MSNARNIEAVLKGGPWNGMKIKVDAPIAELASVQELKLTSGEVLRAETHRYKLTSKGPPLIYEISN